MASPARKSRAYWFVQDVDKLYPHWQQALAESGYKFFYIVHDRDTSEDGTPAFTHVHCCIEFGSPRALEPVRLWLLDKLGVPYCEPVGNKNGVARYYLHLDYPDKAQYDYSELHFYNGAQADPFLHTVSFRDFYDYCMERHIHNLANFFECAFADNREDLANYAFNRAQAVRAFFVDLERELALGPLNPYNND